MRQQPHSSGNTQSEAGKEGFQVSAPSIPPPKGGGAIRGIGEKFGANPVTGTGSMTVPIATSPGRSSFGPQLSLSYDSGAGNGPFGFGWNLSLPSITRKTDKGLPRYEDADESDVFILSGAEDLVPVLVQSGEGWERDRAPRTVGGVDYEVQRYRPRIEGLFARLERWTRKDGDVHWRSISKDNVTTWYGRTSESRIVDPEDGSRVFSWLICESYDDKGNVIVYQYKPEDSQGVDQAQAHERNRTENTRKANCYLKSIRYGNHTPYLPTLSAALPWPTPPGATAPDGSADWFFEIVFDYGEGYYHEQAPDGDGRVFAEATLAPSTDSFWPIREDPFSSYRSGFEVRTYRLCQRVLMFHHFPDELDTADYLVRSTEFAYKQSAIASFIMEVTQSGYVRQPAGTYLKKSLPPLSLEYSQAVVGEHIQVVDPASLENLPVGADGADYQWLDLDGEGMQGVLSELEDGWYYKRNVAAGFDPVVQVSAHPSIAEGMGARYQFLDLAGDGRLDVVQFQTPVAGFFERTDDEAWDSFVPFDSVPNLPWNDANLKFLDLTGDGHADILITENDALTWYPSRAEAGFGTAIRLPKARDEEEGPAVVFADATQAIFVADMSGDGLTDIVRIRNGEVCYWPNLGYGKFGAKVTMDDAPWFDAPDVFDQGRLRLADIDGSGVTDIIYLGADGVRLYFNHSGNGWSDPKPLTVFPRVDSLISVQAVDLLGNGTACLVWTSPLPGDVTHPMRYIDLMGGQKPHLMTKVTNNLGAETVVHYAPSTKFYLADKLAGEPWVTKLPFPVHVVERVETHDLISGNRFITRYRYHHGYFDGVEREFRGFGRVDQLDTEEFASLTASGVLPATNVDLASHVPPVLTKTWFHTGAYFEGGNVTKQFESEYYREGDPSLEEGLLSPEQLQAMLLPDTVLPGELPADEAREAFRSLKSSVLRQEIYALDGTEAEDRPYSVSERNYTIQRLQPRDGKRHSVFFTHPREQIDFQYERRLYEVGDARRADPRVTHVLTLEVDEFGNVKRSAAVGYGRRYDDPNPVLKLGDREKQTQIRITFTLNGFTNPILEEGAYRAPLPCETRTFELIDAKPASAEPGTTNLFRFDELDGLIAQTSDGLHDILYEDVNGAGVTGNDPFRRLIEHARTLYRRDDLAGLLRLGDLRSRALAGESYKLAFTPGLLTQVFQRDSVELLRDPAAVLAGAGPDRGGYVSSEMKKAENLFPGTSADPRWTPSDADGHWWIPSGRIFYARHASATAPQELAAALSRFFFPRRFEDPFGSAAFVDYDVHDLLLASTEDAVANKVAAENNYRVLQPRLVIDPNGNRIEVAFDVLGLVAGTAVMGKAGQSVGDLLDDAFQADLTQEAIDEFSDAVDPHDFASDLLGHATTRIIYDLDRVRRLGEPPFAATLARETHFFDPGGAQTKIQISFSYSDGLGRESQKKIQAESGPAVDNGPEIDPRWVGSGWIIFNNKGKPVRQYEPFFSQFEKRHHFEFGAQVGVSPILFYDPVERVVGTLHPNHTWEKVVFDPWRQTTWDVNDTVLLNPQADPDIGEFFGRLPDEDYLPTWHARRTTPALALEFWPGSDPLAQRTRQDEQSAALKTAVHAGTPSAAWFDTLGRTFLTIAHNRKEAAGPDEFRATRIELDIEGNQRAVIDAKDRVVMHYDYDMLGNRIHQASMDAGERWILNDVTGKPIRAWDSRGHTFRSEYDELRRPARSFVKGADPQDSSKEILFERSEYGEGQPNDAQLNLRTRLFRQFDSAGVLTSEEYDFKGNLRSSRRQLATDYKTRPDWSSGAALEPETFTSSTTYDALNRPLALTTPDNSVVRPTFNEANLLERLDVNLRGDITVTTFVNDIDYDAKGQREFIEYGSGVRTTYEHDRLTFRLINLQTLRNSTSLQDLRYTYDPAGNITSIRDDAQQTIYFNNAVVEPHADYTYDAIYRLIEATGREHIGQTTNNLPEHRPELKPHHDFNDSTRMRLAHPHNGQAMRPYSELYEYDAVGNFERFIHQANGGSWTRRYQYEAGNNQLRSATMPGDPEDGPLPQRYLHDSHGNITRMPHLAQMEWDFEDQLRTVDLGGGGRAYYVYDAGGQRARKVWEKSPGLIEERIYVGGFEVFRRLDGTGNVTLARETLHVMDDKQRIALVETRTLDTAGNDPAPQQLIRYQCGNHLRSASLELDDQSKIISYEEYTPYGSTSYQALRSQTETPKRYRYSGKERDEETSLYYYGARYYAPWLARWTAADPAGLRDGPGLYNFCRDSPVTLFDPNGEEAIAGGALERIARQLEARAAAAAGAKSPAPTLMERLGTLAGSAMSSAGKKFENTPTLRETIEEQVVNQKDEGALKTLLVGETPLGPSGPGGLLGAALAPATGTSKLVAGVISAPLVSGIEAVKSAQAGDVPAAITAASETLQNITPTNLAANAAKGVLGDVVAFATSESTETKTGAAFRLLETAFTLVLGKIGAPKTSPGGTGGSGLTGLLRDTRGSLGGTLPKEPLAPSMRINLLESKVKGFETTRSGRTFRTLEDTLDQLVDIGRAQALGRQKKAPEIASIEKSERRAMQATQTGSKEPVMMPAFDAFFEDLGALIRQRP